VPAVRSDSHRLIAIDGPAASGKSSVARALARRLGFIYVNSGAMYRAVTWYVLDKGVDPTEADAAATMLENADITSTIADRASHILINGIDPEQHLREARVNDEVSRVSAVPRVRKIVDQKMREYARNHDLVVEGRDIGSVVFPNTPFKFYVDASPDVRTRRRAAEGHQDVIAARDLADSSRKAAPLIIARDAVVIDTSNLTIDAVVDHILSCLKSKGLPLMA
jgi:cytidylate kinase